MARPSRSAGSPKDRFRLDEHHRGRRREIMGNELFQQVSGEFREFVLEFELHSCGKKSGSLQQAADQRVDAVIQKAAQALRNPRVFFGELARMLVEQLKFRDCRDREIPDSCPLTID